MRLWHLHHFLRRRRHRRQLKVQSSHPSRCLTLQRPKQSLSLLSSSRCTSHHRYCRRAIPQAPGRRYLFHTRFLRTSQAACHTKYRQAHQKGKGEAEAVDLEDPKAAAPEPSQPSELSQPSQASRPKGPPECLREEWEEAQQRQAADTAAASGAVVAAKSAASSAEEVPPFTVPDSYQGDPEERRHIICRFQGLRPLEEFCVCIDFHNVLDLGNGGRFQAVDQRTVGALRDLLVDCAPARLHICSFTGRAQAQHYWEENIIPCQDQLREALSSPTIRVTAQQCFQRTGEGGKVHTLSTLEPRRPHVIIDDNADICKEARRTNALVVQVNKRLGVIGLVDELRVLRNTIQFYNRDRLLPAFILQPHRYLPNS